MRTLKNVVGIAAGLALVAVPVAAQAAANDVAQERVSTEIEGENLRGVLLPLVALIVFALAVILMNGDKEAPVSP